MKIKSLDIASFGKFKNYHLDLSDGLTVLYGENEKGKSTIMAFIRMMFYGSTGKAQGLDKNFRKKYRPWSSDLMAGAITFECGGVNYRLEREFKATNSTDKISLINLDLGEKESVSGSDDIGAKFFGLTDGAFERSVFISEPALAAKNEAADGEINARLSTIATTSDDDVSFEKVYLRIRNAKEALLSKSRKIGKLDKAEGEILDLESKIRDAIETENAVLSMKEEAQNKEAEIKASSDAAALLFEQLKNSDKIKKKNFLSRYIAAEKERAAAKGTLALKDGGYADKAYIDSLKALFSDVSLLNEKLSEAKAEAEGKKAEITALQNEANALSPADEGQTASLEEKRVQLDADIDAARKVGEALQGELTAQKPTLKNNIALIIIGLIITAVGAAGFFLMTEQIIRYASLGGVLLGQLLFVLGFILKRKIMPDTAELTAKINENSALLDTLLKNKEELIEKLSSIKNKNSSLEIEAASKKALIESKSSDLTAVLSEIETISEELANTKASLEAKLKNLTVEISQNIVEVLEQALGYYEMISQKITVLADNAAVSSLKQAEEKLANLNRDASTPDLSEGEIDSLKERFKAQSDNTSALKAELAAIKEKIKAVTASTPPVAVLERQKEELIAKIKAYREYTDTSDLALTTLDEAFRDLRKNYSEVLDQRTAEIFTRLSDDRYLSVNVSKSMELSVTTSDAFGTKESGYLSRGTEDQLYLAMRLAVAELITNEGEKLPIFADDSLSQYDDGRTKKAFSFLKEYAKDKQIIMFTCHSFIKSAAESLDIKTLDM